MTYEALKIGQKVFVHTENVPGYDGGAQGYGTTLTGCEEVDERDCDMPMVKVEMVWNGERQWAEVDGRIFWSSEEEGTDEWDLAGETPPVFTISRSQVFTLDEVGDDRMPDDSPPERGE